MDRCEPSQPRQSVCGHIAHGKRALHCDLAMAPGALLPCLAEARDMTRVVLASASPARARLLRDAGIAVHIEVSNVDERELESAMPDATPEQICLALAQAKARDVAERINPEPDTIIIGADSVLDVDGTSWGKPATEEVARQRWHAMAGRSAVLRTGHWLIAGSVQVGQVASTTVWHGTLSDAELDAYIATGEPLQVAGGFTLDGLGAPFIDRIEGDPSNVIGLSLPLLRSLLATVGVTWPSLW